MATDGIKVLLVDDSPTVRRLGELILSQHGYNVYTAEDGEQGLEMIQKIRPSVILVDFIMPNMNGHTFCRKVREDDSFKDIPLILISSKGESVGEAFEKEFGVLYYFSKPFEPDDLINKMEEVLKDVVVEEPEEESAKDTGGPMTSPAVLHEMIDKLLRQYFQKDFPLLMRNVMSDMLTEAGLIKKGGVILSGSLEKIPLPDVINFASNSRLSGRLTIFSRDVFGEIFIEDGMFVFASCSKKGGKQPFLTDIMKKQKLLTVDDDTIRDVVTEARERCLPIGRMLVEKRLVNEGQLMEALRLHAMDAFGNILSAKTGSFFLEQDELPTNLRDMQVRISLMNVLMEGLSQLDERQLAATEFKDESMVLVRLITNEDAMDTVQLKARELDIFALIDGHKPLSEIIHLSQLDPLETKRICYALRKVGLLRLKAA
ncbi:response regulator [Malonomonas rubra]|uniref:response regulator n=1 Tax=Malonomonas rubra TaxID=57040 RepID=UPI0026F2D8F3|nr:response regulator [Malonomonas rubra]